MVGYWLRRIRELDPVDDHSAIYRISSGFEFPWDYRRALEFALFRTYCVPSISALLEATGEFERRPQKRYDDTALLMAEIAEHGYESPRGRSALRMVNRAHGHYVISNDDMKYVLSTFIYDPIDWISEVGWRPLDDRERLAAFHHYRQVGIRMGIRDIPESYGDFRDFKQDYERAHFRYSETNRRIGMYTHDLFCGWFPRSLYPVVSLGVRALLDRPMLEAFGFRAAPVWLTFAARAALHARSTVVRVLPRRRKSRLAGESRNRTYPGYPNGYRPEDLGAGDPPAGIDERWLRESRAAPKR